ncbi:MAG: ATP-binding protein [Polyangiales bacterium]
MQDRPLDPSLKLLLDALAASPDNAPLRVHVAAALEKAGQFRAALEHFDRVEGDAAHGDEALLGATRCLLALQDVEGAFARVDRLVSRAPGHALGLLLRAKVRERRREHREARKDYERAVALDPSLSDTALWDALGKREADAEPDDDEASEPEAKVDFSTVGGLDELKERIRMRIVHPFQRPELFKAYGKRVGGGVLFYGPPGCGKTFLARATAGECGAHFMAVGLHEVLDMWIGNSERQLHAVFEEARRRAPTVLFFDEVDTLGMQRAKLVSGGMRGVITQFLSELDSFNNRNDRVLVIGATNTPWDLDSAFRRPGRFDQVLFVPPPDTPARAQILALKLRGKPVAEGLDLERLAGLTESWSGADLEHLIEYATELAIERSMKTGVVEPITMAFLDGARARIKPTTREWFSAAKNYAQYANEAGQYDDIADYMRRHRLNG